MYQITETALIVRCVFCMQNILGNETVCYDLTGLGQVGLLNAPGSLMIDVFIRGNFTADSNAMMAGFLKEFANAEIAVDNQPRADQLVEKAATMADAMNAMLWAADGDHYITQRNPDGSTRDFVDYDANLIALAHNVPNTTAQAQKILSRIDRGRCSAASGAGPQFVSERYYGKTAACIRCSFNNR